MIFVKRAAAMILVLCMALSLAACGNSASSGTNSGDASVGAASSDVIASTSADASADSSEDAGASSDEPVDDGRVTYTITVVDEEGNPISGAMVQLCKETCLPCGATNADGVVSVTTVEDDYKVSFMTPVEGYVTDGLEFYFDAGSTEMTIVLTAAE